MAQADASGLTQGARRLADTVSGYINRIPTPSMRRPDTSWHDDMVRRANEAFRQQAEREAAARAAGAAASSRQPVKRTPPKRTPPRPAAKRR